MTDTLLGYLILAALLCLIVWLNVSNYLTRRTMTPEERKRIDEETERFGGDW